jgi:hypothetical protein
MGTRPAERSCHRGSVVLGLGQVRVRSLLHGIRARARVRIRVRLDPGPGLVFALAVGGRLTVLPASPRRPSRERALDLCLLAGRACELARLRGLAVPALVKTVRALPEL